jgi:cytochrome c biogenesis protein CcmG/thiol:disulfide interchange protein DsbE
VDRRSLLAAAALALMAPLSRATAILSEWKGPPAAPPIELFTPDGTLFTLASLRGQVVLVNFWATWCEPCVTEMPALQRLRDQFAPRFEILGVNYQEGPARIKSFIDRTGISFPIVRDTDGAVAKAWGARIFPASYVVDRTGDVRHVLIGAADWTSPGLVSTIRKLL